MPVVSRKRSPPVTSDHPAHLDAMWARVTYKKLKRASGILYALTLFVISDSWASVNPSSTQWPLRSKDGILSHQSREEARRRQS